MRYIASLLFVAVISVPASLSHAEGVRPYQAQQQSFYPQPIGQTRLVPVQPMIPVQLMQTGPPVYAVPRHPIRRPWPRRRPRPRGVWGIGIPLGFYY